MAKTHSLREKVLVQEIEVLEAERALRERQEHLAQWFGRVASWVADGR